MEIDSGDLASYEEVCVLLRNAERRAKRWEKRAKAAEAENLRLWLKLRERSPAPSPEKTP